MLKAFSIAMLAILILADLFIGSHAVQTTLSSMHINTTWAYFCQEQTSFKQSLSNFIIYNTRVVTRPYQILFINADASCANAGLSQSHVHLSVSINHPAPNDANQDMDMLKKMVKLLENGANVGGMQVISAKLVTTDSSTKQSIAPKTVIIIIGVVLAVYLLGYFCVLSTQSDSHDEAHVPKAYMVSTVNKVYTGRRSIEDVYTVGERRM